MCPKSKIQFEEIRRERRGLIMDTALRLFAEKGYHQTSISQIAREAGMSKGLMYNYFDSKEALLGEIFQEGFNQAYENFDQNQDGILQKEEFVDFVYRIKSLIDGNHNFWQLLVNLILQPGTLTSLGDFKLKGADDIDTLLREYFIALGYEDPEFEKTYCISVLQGAFIQYIFDHEKYPIDKVIERIVKLYA
ncbi:MAG: TetR/AcrR family transcriptional regulator [Bacteroidales bacterium]|nr:TetR/AcrR family transcriptional regulator [Bacteroidales bacterium]HOY37691.1 TetR/AcrR family transcriptional regulator [Bacteroidales bacterium]HQP04541.1 TetR/AcrR family transcriptional regulator [Bacteroidales bacterium]